MMRALIVDDDPESLYWLRMLLQAHGYIVDEARHGAEALDKARQDPPDLTISDLLMPIVDGYTLLREWKTDDHLKTIPLVIYTATYTGPKDERLALTMSADDFIIKPAEPDVFMSRIEKVVAKQQKGEVSSAQALENDCNTLLRVYNETLIRKLEQKAFQLEQANRELRAEIAERQRAEVELRASEDRYRTLFEAITDPLFVYDRETLAYLAVNDAAVSRYGYSREEFLKMTVKDIRPPEDVPALLSLLARSGTSREKRGLWRHQKKDGTILDVEIYAYGLDFLGRPACLVEARDVTEQRRAQAKLAHTTELMRAFADGTPDAVFIKDRQGKYLLFNQAAARFVGRPIDEVIGKDDR